MPEFQLNTPERGHAYYRLTPFAKQYVEAMFFTNGDCGDDGDENKLNHLGTERLTKAACKDIERDCQAFLSHIMPDGCFVQQWLDRAEDAGYDRGGHDFWFSRRGHGVGFWDRDEIPEPMRDPLHAAAKAQGEAYCWRNRGWIYHGR